MHVICKRFLGTRDDLRLEVRRRSDIQILAGDRRKYQPLPNGHGAKALAARLAAGKDGFNAVVYMADADTNDVAVWCQKYADILDGFSRVQNGVAAIACVPMSASESWFLADADAWKDLGLTNPVILPSHPEAIWGARDDPNGNHPHRLFKRVCVAADQPDSRETRCELAMKTDLSLLGRKCQRSFGEFVKDMSVLRAPEIKAEVT